jgi:hypothetical protein
MGGTRDLFNPCRSTDPRASATASSRRVTVALVRTLQHLNNTIHYPTVRSLLHVKMILSATPLYHHTLRMPSRPSPLAERPVNVQPRAFQFTMSPQSLSEKQQVPQRPHKPNPLIQDRETATQRRREMFFRRVQRDRDDKKWGARGEQVSSRAFSFLPLLTSIDSTSRLCDRTETLGSRKGTSGTRD